LLVLGLSYKEAKLPPLPGSLADGGVGLLLEGVPLDAMAADIHAVTLAGTSPYSSMPVDTSLSALSGVIPLRRCRMPAVA
jgi:hypothetical protein